MKMNGKAISLAPVEIIVDQQSIFGEAGQEIIDCYDRNSSVSWRLMNGIAFPEVNPKAAGG